MPGFKKGQSGNPGGRSKIALILAELGEDPKALRKEIFALHIKIVRAGPKGTNDATFRYSSDFVCGHLGIKPKEHIVHEFGAGDADGELDFESMSDEELDAIIASAEQDKEPAPDGGGDPAVH